jgi:hypothetical protein
MGTESTVKTQSIYTGEMPPAAPGFDARFTSTGGMIVSYPEKSDGKMDYAISVTTNAYPVTISWETVEPLTLYAQDNKVCDMTGSGSVQMKNPSGLSVRVGKQTISPDRFSLGKNFPNPFNPSTKFTVEIPRAGGVKLEIYNILGQKIKTLMNGEVLPGSYNMEWDGTDEGGFYTPSGIYFIRMSSGTFTDVQKILLMK